MTVPVVLLLTAGVSFAVCFSLQSVFLPKLAVMIGGNIRSSVPAFGGVFTAAASVFASAAGFAGLYFADGRLAGGDGVKTMFWLSLTVSFCAALTGFADDYARVFANRPYGLRSYVRMICAAVVVSVFSGTAVFRGENYISLPFYGNADAGVFYPAAAVLCAVLCFYCTAGSCSGDTDCGAAPVTGFGGLCVIALLARNYPAAVSSAACFGAFGASLVSVRREQKMLPGKTGVYFYAAGLAALTLTLHIPWLAVLCGAVTFAAKKSKRNFSAAAGIAVFALAAALIFLGRPG